MIDHISASNRPPRRTTSGSWSTTWGAARSMPASWRSRATGSKPLPPTETLAGRPGLRRATGELSGRRVLNAHRLDPRTDVHDAFQLWQDAQAANTRSRSTTSTTVVCFHAGIRMRIDVRRKTLKISRRICWSGPGIPWTCSSTGRVSMDTNQPRGSLRRRRTDANGHENASRIDRQGTRLQPFGGRGGGPRGSLYAGMLLGYPLSASVAVAS